jgi:hypothetical protein
MIWIAFNCLTAQQLLVLTKDVQFCSEVTRALVSSTHNNSSNNNKQDNLNKNIVIQKLDNTTNIEG